MTFKGSSIPETTSPGEYGSGTPTSKPPSGRRPPTWSVGLLDQSDWGTARWIEYPGRTENQPMPIFARQFRVRSHQNGRHARAVPVGRRSAPAHPQRRAELDDEVLAPGNANYQLSSEYRTYDLTDALRTGDNTLGVQLGNGPGVRAAQRHQPGRRPDGALLLVAEPVDGQRRPGRRRRGRRHHRETRQRRQLPRRRHHQRRHRRRRRPSRVPHHHGDRHRRRRRDRHLLHAPLSKPHLAGATVTGSGNNVAASDPSAGAAVTPRLIGRLEISYTDGAETVIVTDRGWRTALGALVTDAWYSGADYDARREQVGWDSPRSDLSTSRQAAGRAPHGLDRRRHRAAAQPGDQAGGPHGRTGDGS